MRMLDVEREQGVRTLQLYLSPTEAEALHRHLGTLLLDPEANRHQHVHADDMSRELSLSIVTTSKLSSGRYTALERRILDEG